MVKNPPYAGDMGSISGQGTKFPHTVRQLSQCSTMRESVHHNRISHMPKLKPDTTK